MEARTDSDTEMAMGTDSDTHTHTQKHMLRDRDGSATDTETEVEIDICTGTESGSDINTQANFKRWHQNHTERQFVLGLPCNLHGLVLPADLP